VALAFLIIVICGYFFGWKWTGLPGSKVPSNTQPTKNLWDWLDLLIVPIVLAIGGYLFTSSENRRTREDADEQRQLDRQLADERRQDEALQAYLDQMSDMLIPKQDQPSLYDEKPPDSLRTVARARTLTVLPRLAGDRKARVIQFLYESRLITKDRVIVVLTGADLSGADLSGADLTDAALIGTDMSEVVLSGADLRAYVADPIGADLSDYFDLLREAKRNTANLLRADLRNVSLRRAILIAANLHGTDLRGANLRGADLDWANLSRTKGITNEELEQQAASLKGATMPNGQKYEDWLKDREGSKEDAENE
jgi:uncharacterized protein YjbI with pentapeptide repeats